MRLSSKDRIVDYSLVKFRNFLKRYMYGYFDVEDFIRYSKEVEETEIEKIFEEALKLGYIEKYDGIRIVSDINNTDKQFTTTQKGLALCNARCISPLNKEKADRHFNDFMERVIEVNNNDDYLYRVEEVYLFGSYIDPGAKDYGDIDIVVILRKRYDGEEFERRDKEAVRNAIMQGKQMPSILDRLVYTRNAVLKALKGKDRYISIHGETDFENLGCQFIRVYPKSNVVGGNGMQEDYIG